MAAPDSFTAAAVAASDIDLRFALDDSDDCCGSVFQDDIYRDCCFSSDAADPGAGLDTVAPIASVPHTASGSRNNKSVGSGHWIDR